MAASIWTRLYALAVMVILSVCLCSQGMSQEAMSSTKPPTPAASSTSDELTQHNETQKQYHTELSKNNTMSNVSYQFGGTNRSSVGHTYLTTGPAQDNKVHITNGNVEIEGSNATLPKVNNKTMGTQGCLMPNGSYTNDTAFCQEQKLRNSGVKGKPFNSLDDSSEMRGDESVWNVVSETPESSRSSDITDNPSQSVVSNVESVQFPESNQSQPSDIHKERGNILTHKFNVISKVQDGSANNAQSENSKDKYHFNIGGSPPPREGLGEPETKHTFQVIDAGEDADKNMINTEVKSEKYPASNVEKQPYSLLSATPRKVSEYTNPTTIIPSSVSEWKRFVSGSTQGVVTENMGWLSRLLSTTASRTTKRPQSTTSPSFTMTVTKSLWGSTTSGPTIKATTRLPSSTTHGSNIKATTTLQSSTTPSSTIMNLLRSTTRGSTMSATMMLQSSTIPDSATKVLQSLTTPHSTIKATTKMPQSSTTSGGSTTSPTSTIMATTKPQSSTSPGPSVMVSKMLQSSTTSGESTTSPGSTIKVNTRQQNSTTPDPSVLVAKKVPHSTTPGPSVMITKMLEHHFQHLQSDPLQTKTDQQDLHSDTEAARPFFRVVEKQTVEPSNLPSYQTDSKAENKNVLSSQEENSILHASDHDESSVTESILPKDDLSHEEPIKSLSHASTEIDSEDSFAPEPSEHNGDSVLPVSVDNDNKNLLPPESVKDNSEDESYYSDLREHSEEDLYPEPAKNMAGMDSGVVEASSLFDSKQDSLMDTTDSSVVRIPIIKPTLPEYTRQRGEYRMNLF